MTDDLLGVAAMLVDDQRHPLTQGSLRRAVSTAYYAVFHALAQSNADVLVASSSADENWVRCYRAMDHVGAKKVLAGLTVKDKTHPLVAFAETFSELQEQRHTADYDPSSSFDAVVVGTLIADAREAIDSFRSLPSEIRRDLASRILFKTRP